MSNRAPRDDDPDDHLWISGCTYGVVRHVIVKGDYAASLDDLNSDYREVALVLRRLREGRWETFYEEDDVGLLDAAGFGWTDGLLWGLGRGRPDTELELPYDDGVVSVAVDSAGWWLLIRPEPDYPYRVMYELEQWLRVDHSH